MTQRLLPLSFLALTVAAAWTAAAPPARPPEGITLPVTIVSVWDGDTATVQFTGRLQIRLDSCWAPELSEGGGRESGDNLRAIAVGKRGTLFIPGRDIKHLGQLTTLGRVVGWLWVDGSEESLNARQVRTKHAATAKGLPLGR